MQQKNKYFVLKSNTDTRLIKAADNKYSTRYRFTLDGPRVEDNRYKPIFILASDVLYDSVEIQCYDKNDLYLGYKVGTFVQSERVIELYANTSYIFVSIISTSEDYSKYDAKIWFYVGYEVVSHHKKIELQRKKENNQVFFRESLSGSIKLFGDDYEFVKSASLEQNMLFVVYNINGQLVAKNSFNKTDCKFDHFKCSVELKLSPEDKYTKIIDKYDNTYDIIKLAPAVSHLTLTKRMAYQIYVAGSNNITTVANGTYWEDDVNEVIDDIKVLNNKYYFGKVGDSRYEIHLSDFNYDINATYIIDKESNVWNAESEFTIWVDGEQRTYKVPASIKFTKIADAGDVVPAYRRVYMLSDGVSIGNPDRWNMNNGHYAYDAYKIEIYTGRDGTGDLIYQSEHDYCADKGFLMSPGMDNYPMVCVMPQSHVAKVPTPERFILGKNIIEYAICCRIICDIDKVVVGGKEYTLYDLPYDDFTYTRANYKKCIGLVGLTLHQIRATSTKPTKYGMDDYGKYFTSNFLGPYSTEGRPIPVSRSSWANTSIWVTFGDNWVKNFEAKFRKEYILKHAYSLENVISAMLAKIDPSIKHEGTAEYSQFLYSGISPLFNDAARNGYKIYITPKSNVLKGDYDQAAQKAELTFEQLMNMLRECFRCYWFIDNQNRFRIEHISYFMNGKSYTSASSQLDLTRKADKFNKKAALYCQQEVEYDKSELEARYEFGWMDDCTDLFGNNSIDINSKYIQRDKTEEINVDMFSSDVDLMLYCPDKFSSDGFALLIAKSSNGKVPIVTSDNFKDDEYLGPMMDGRYRAAPQNYLASWLYLMRYYMTDMPAANIEYDGIIPSDAMRVMHIKKSMKHSIEFPTTGIDIDMNKLITTEIGNGQIDEMSTNIDTNMTSIELRYEPE